MRKTPPARLVILLTVLLATAVAWSASSRWSPYHGWPSEVLTAWREARLRRAAVRPCLPTSWTESEMSTGVSLAYPTCYQAHANDGHLILWDGSTTRPILFSVFHGPTDTWIADRAPYPRWVTCGLDGRDNVHCYEEAVAIGGDELLLRARLVVLSGAAIFIQAGLPVYLAGTETDERLMSTLSQICLRSRGPEPSAPPLASGSQDLDTWLALRQLLYVMTVSGWPDPPDVTP